MHVVVVGLNHRSAPIELRERLAFHREQLPATLRRLRVELGLEEAAILSTCNRVEIYAGVPQLGGAVDRLQRFLSQHGRVELPHLAERLYSYTEPQSVRHLFSVTSGLDSMVLGEGEILQQVKHAYEWAKEAGATGKVLNVLFQRALNAAKAVRTQTAIGEGCTSIGSVAVELAEKIFGSLNRTTVLLIGAGKVGELALARLRERGVPDLRVLNRSSQRAQRIAESVAALAGGLERLSEQLAVADIVMTSTSAPEALITPREIVRAMRQRHQRSLCLIDLGVPRNIDPAVGRIENVYLFNIDDLQGLVEHAATQRALALQASQAIIDRKVDRFLSWWHEEVVPCVPSGSGLAEAP
jgi:glutamyl-tRNA reductase